MLLYPVDLIRYKNCSGKDLIFESRQLFTLSFSSNTILCLQFRLSREFQLNLIFEDFAELFLFRLSSHKVSIFVGDRQICYDNKTQIHLLLLFYRFRFGHFYFSRLQRRVAIVRKFNFLILLINWTGIIALVWWCGTVFQSGIHNWKRIIVFKRITMKLQREGFLEISPAFASRLHIRIQIIENQIPKVSNSNENGGWPNWMVQTH